MYVGIQLAWPIFFSQLAFLAVVDFGGHGDSCFSAEPAAKKTAVEMPGLQQPGSGSLPALPGLRLEIEKPLPRLQPHR